MADRFNMSDVMISYSRRDKAFVRQLEQALREDNLETWVDWDEIPPTVDWWQEIQAGIEAAHTIVFVITPASVQSEVCRREIDHALLHHKRLVPILHQELSADDQAKLHPALATHNWIYFREDDHFRRAFLMLRTALETDLDHKKLHTRLLVRSRDWEERGHSASLLLRGDDLRQAENWLAKAIAGQAPHPTERQIDYIHASNQASRRLAQRLIGGTATALLLIVAGMVFALTQSQRANAETNRALVEAQLRSTQEWLANAGLAQAATAQKIAEDSANAAATAQGLVLLAQTQEQQALQDAGNSQTQAFIAQQSALTATVLQGQANDLAATAQNEQEDAEAAAGQAEQQAQQAQAQAQQAQSAQQQAEQAGNATATAAAATVRAALLAAEEIQIEANGTLRVVNMTLTALAENLASFENDMTATISVIQNSNVQAQQTLTQLFVTQAAAGATLSAAQTRHAVINATGTAWERVGPQTEAAATTEFMSLMNRLLELNAAAAKTAEYVEEVRCKILNTC